MYGMDRSALTCYERRHAFATIGNTRPAGGDGNDARPDLTRPGLACSDLAGVCVAPKSGCRCRRDGWWMVLERGRAGGRVGNGRSRPVRW